MENDLMKHSVALNTVITIVGFAITIASMYFSISTKQEVILDKLGEMTHDYKAVQVLINNHEKRISILETKH